MHKGSALGLYIVKSAVHILGIAACILFNPTSARSELFCEYHLERHTNSDSGNNCYKEGVSANALACNNCKTESAVYCVYLRFGNRDSYPYSNSDTTLSYCSCTSCQDGYKLTEHHSFMVNYKNFNCNGTEMVYTCERQQQPDQPSTTVTCSAGQYLYGSRCTNCPAGSYCPGGTWNTSSGTQGLFPCSGDTISRAGATSCEKCGQYQKANSTHTKCEQITKKCKDGFYLNGSSSECTQCPVGSYCPGGTWGLDGKDKGLNSCGTASTVFTQPSSGNQSSTNAQYTSNAGSKSIRDCYLNSGTYYDIAGTFTISNNCPHIIQ